MATALGLSQLTSSVNFSYFHGTYGDPYKPSLIIPLLSFEHKRRIFYLILCGSVQFAPPTQKIWFLAGDISGDTYPLSGIETHLHSNLSEFYASSNTAEEVTNGIDASALTAIIIVMPLLLQCVTETIPVTQLVRETAAVMQEFTQSGGVRPFGVSLLVAGFDDNGPQLYQV
ncbi:hypothetical protein MKW98_025137 [Papaver atlanticum]|uniref:Uncharacterized protein n=1 Tax=Papaver atlanticum TaxID=357466 RepID=A0AAD4S1L3_9MAGN|nr:hypothetical protein MKW98_025137 [Papaver atlanticum]